MTAIGDTVRRLRTGLGLSQATLAFRAGLNPQTISRLERGEAKDPEAETIKALAGALGVESAVLAADVVKPPEEAPVDGGLRVAEASAAYSERGQRDALEWLDAAMRLAGIAPDSEQWALIRRDIVEAAEGSRVTAALAEKIIKLRLDYARVLAASHTDITRTTVKRP